MNRGKEERGAAMSNDRAQGESKDKLASFKRDKTAVLSLFLAILLACYPFFTGCSAQATSFDAGSSDAQDSATVDEGFSIPPALGDEYDTALAAVQQDASDAVLIAVRSSTIVSADTPCSWSYLFASPSQGNVYTAFTNDGQAYPALYGQYSPGKGSWDEIPPESQIAVDADTAFNLVCQQMGSTPVTNCYIYLLLYVAEQDDPLAGTLVWYLELNTPDGSASTTSDSSSTGSGASGSSSTSATNGDDATADGSATPDASTSGANGNGGASDSASQPQFIYTVDAQTGTVTQVR
jgi:hypothetical protein